ncbi:Putative amidase domain [Actinobaculum suis]|uniref:Amidase domain n=1 Tax=Actinobaculum suis TaxID=1657 RepID=A0A7Z9C7N3_9ACTO|nr:amidase domain-containing protein [Actinobaculum suis]VDG75531.1 Putative amidase domain [Actinobaculum suis]
MNKPLNTAIFTVFTLVAIGLHSPPPSVVDTISPDDSLALVAEYGNAHSSRAIYSVGGVISVDGPMLYDDADAATSQWVAAAPSEAQIFVSNCGLHTPITSANYDDWWECAMEYAEDVPAALWHLSRLKNTFLQEEFEEVIESWSQDPSNTTVADLGGYLPLTDNNSELLANLDESQSLGGPTNELIYKHNYLNARNYAIQWAWSPNPSYTDFSRRGGDCANFVSQIMRAGGRPDNNSWSPYRPAWIRANSLASHLGLAPGRGRYTDFAGFKAHAYTNAVIFADFDGDNHYDHSGFLVEASGENRLVAQHTKNYLGWMIPDHRQPGVAKGWQRSSAWGVVIGW